MGLGLGLGLASLTLTLRPLTLTRAARVPTTGQLLLRGGQGDDGPAGGAGAEGPVEGPAEAREP